MFFVPETSVASIGFNCPDSHSRGKGMTVDIAFDLARDSSRVTLCAHEVRYIPGLPNDLLLVLVMVTLGSVLHFVLKATLMVMLAMDIVYIAERAGLFWLRLRRTTCSCKRGIMCCERPWNYIRRYSLLWTMLLVEHRRNCPRIAIRLLALFIVQDVPSWTTSDYCYWVHWSIQRP